MKKLIKILFVMVLTVAFAVSTFFIYQYFSTFNTEQEVFEVIAEEYENTDEEIPQSKEHSLLSLYEQNDDLIGWIQIEDTNINYPVMLGDYYLNHNFNKEYSDYGVPFVLDGITDNTIIYGHNMKTNTMFHELINYADYDVYKENKYIEFTTLESSNYYEIVYAFKTTGSSDIYNYSSFNSADDFAVFNSKCSELSLYDTGVKAEYGDKLITLSTCEYSRNDGSFVVIAKKVK